MQRATNFIINGNTGKVKYLENNTIFLESLKGILPIFLVFENACQYYPLGAWYSSTVHKIIGQDLHDITLAFDLRTLSPTVGYVALSRVSSFDKVVPMLRLRKSHFLTLVNVMVYVCNEKYLFFGRILFSWYSLVIMWNVKNSKSNTINFLYGKVFV